MLIPNKYNFYYYTQSEQGVIANGGFRKRGKMSSGTVLQFAFSSIFCDPFSSIIDSGTLNNRVISTLFLTTAALKRIV